MQKYLEEFQLMILLDFWQSLKNKKIKNAKTVRRISTYDLTQFLAKFKNKKIKIFKNT